MSPTKISWADETWNVTAGCNKVSAGCEHCYAMREAHRLAGNPNPKVAAPYKGTTRQVRGKGAQWTGLVKCLPDRLDIPKRWRKPRRIFVDSMSDLFHPDVPFSFIAMVFGVMADCPQHTFLVLTKRPERMAQFLKGWGRTGYRGFEAPSPLPNVRLGTSVENQAAADLRVPHLLDCPAAVRFLSCEPLLGPVDLRMWAYPAPDQEPLEDPRIHQVIVGGESGPGSSPMHPDWARSLRDQCTAAGVAFHFKQWGNWVPPEVLGEGEGHPVGYWPETFTEDARGPWEFMRRTTKKAAGRELDGRTWEEEPDGS